MKAKLHAIKRTSNLYAPRGGEGVDNSDSDSERSSSSSSSSASSSSSVGEDLALNLTMSRRDREILEARRREEEKKKAVMPYTNKQRLMILCSRGITTRYRHLMDDVKALLPHHRSEVKLDTKKQLSELNEICEMKECNGCMFFEVRKKKDLFLWITRSPNGPSAKFHVTNVHTMDELRMTGNTLLGSRPILSFSGFPSSSGEATEEKTTTRKPTPELDVVRELLEVTLGTPKGHPKSKPFIDRVTQISYLDGRIWFRNYQIAEVTTDAKEVRRKEKLGESTVEMIEIGPRFALTLVKVFEGGFGGRALYENAAYVSPNTQRSEAARALGNRYVKRKLQERQTVERKKSRLESLPEDVYKRVFR